MTYNMQVNSYLLRYIYFLNNPGTFFYLSSPKNSLVCVRNLFFFHLSSLVIPHGHDPSNSNVFFSSIFHYKGSSVYSFGVFFNILDTANVITLFQPLLWLLSTIQNCRLLFLMLQL